MATGCRQRAAAMISGGGGRRRIRLASDRSIARRASSTLELLVAGCAPGSCGNGSCVSRVGGGGRQLKGSAGEDLLEGECALGAASADEAQRPNERRC
jgi:hypothetical protein